MRNFGPLIAVTVAFLVAAQGSPAAPAAGDLTAPNAVVAASMESAVTKDRPYEDLAFSNARVSGSLGVGAVDVKSDLGDFVAVFSVHPDSAGLDAEVDQPVTCISTRKAEVWDVTAEHLGVVSEDQCSHGRSPYTSGAWVKSLLRKRDQYNRAIDVANRRANHGCDEFNESNVKFARCLQRIYIRHIGPVNRRLIKFSTAGIEGTSWASCQAALMKLRTGVRDMREGRLGIYDAYRRSDFIGLEEAKALERGGSRRAREATTTTKAECPRP